MTGKGLTSKILPNNALLEHSVAEPTKHRVLLRKIDAVKYFLTAMLVGAVLLSWTCCDFSPKLALYPWKLEISSIRTQKGLIEDN